jgi:hypothetical protein
MSSLLFSTPSVANVLIGAGLGYVGLNLYDSYKSGTLNIVTPDAYLYLVKSAPMTFGAPLLGGYVGYVMGQGYGGGYSSYIGGVLGGFLGTLLAPRPGQ